MSGYIQFIKVSSVNLTHTWGKQGTSAITNQQKTSTLCVYLPHYKGPSVFIQYTEKVQNNVKYELGMHLGMCINVQCHVPNRGGNKKQFSFVNTKIRWQHIYYHKTSTEGIKPSKSVIICNYKWLKRNQFMTKIFKHCKKTMLLISKNVVTKQYYLGKETSENKALV